MSEAIGQPGQAALPRPLGIGEILSTAFRLYQRHWRTLLAIAAVVVVPLTLLQYLLGDWLRSRGEITSLQQVSTATWAVGAAGLKVERVWTSDGVHPYDEVAWERRDVVMTNWRDGSINFEQRGVEFPVSWSVNAANIVTTKYFRGAVGTEAREVSLKQLIDRVVKTYRLSLIHI